MLRKLTLIITGLSFLLGHAAMANNGKIKGSITESQNGEAVGVPFANVFLLGTTVGTSTDFDGNFEFSAPAGDYVLVVSTIGMKPDTCEIKVKPGETLTINRKLGVDSKLLDVFVVESKANRENESVLLMEQKNSATIQQSIGANELSKQGASDVAQGVSKVSGIAKSDANSDIFVRGLGDRYNNALVNGMPIPSSNPDKKIIPLDIFPTAIVQSIGVNKTFTPELYADFAGATISVNTKDYFEKPHLEIGVSTKINSITTFKDFRQGAQTSNLNRFGYGYEDRMIPSTIGADYYSSPADVASPFKRSLNINTTQAAPSTGISILGGNSYKLGDHSKFGFLLSGSHGNDYSFQSGVDRNFDTYGYPVNAYTTEKYTYSTLSTGLANFYLKLDKRNTLKVNSLYTHNTADQFSAYNTEINERDRNRYTYNIRDFVRTNTLFSNQLIGNHQIGRNDQFILNWGASYSKAENNEPDRVQLMFADRDRDQDTLNIEKQNVSDNHRFFSQLTETEKSGKSEFRWNFKHTDDGHKVIGSLSMGANVKLKSRDFMWRQFNMYVSDLHNRIDTQGIALDPYSADNYLSDQNLEKGLFEYNEQKDGSRKHHADQNVYAAYLLLDYDLTPRLKVVAGARIEKSHQEIQYKKVGSTLRSSYLVHTYDTLNILPSFSLRYGVNEKSNLRIALSQTASRPNLRELAPFQYQDQSRRLYEGNIALTNAYCYNADIKYERFANEGEVFAVTAYGKYISNPIEVYQISSSGTLLTFLNVKEAKVAGIEFEAKKSVGHIFKGLDFSGERILDRTQVGVNASYNYTQIYTGSEGAFTSSKGSVLATNNRRPMVGASPVLLSGMLAYSFSIGNIKSNWSMVYNVFGKRVYAAGVQGSGDIYEMPVNTLDFIAKNTISEKIDIDFKVMNILNPNISLKQAIQGEQLIYNQYKRGVTYGLTVNYRLFK